MAARLPRRNAKLTSCAQAVGAVSAPLRRFARSLPGLDPASAGCYPLLTEGPFRLCRSALAEHNLELRPAVRSCCDASDSTDLRDAPETNLRYQKVSSVGSVHEATHSDVHHNTEGHEREQNRRAAVTHQRQRYSGDRHKANHHPDVDEYVEG